MLYLFSGDDTKKKLAAYEGFLKDQKDGKGSAETFFMNKKDVEAGALQGFYSGASLFAARSTIVLRDVLEEEEIRALVLPHLAAMGESANTFIFLEGKLPKPVLDAFKKARSELNVFEAPKEKKEKFNSFAIANSFGQKDKLGTWLTFRQAVERDVALDELAGILFWKAKDMLLKRNFGKWKEGELEDFAARIARLLPEARRAGPEAESAMEQFLLEAF